MTHHQQDGQNSRIRNVPIFIEGRDQNNDDQTPTRNYTDRLSGQPYSNQTVPQPYPDSDQNSSHTSNVNINYGQPRNRPQQYQQPPNQDKAYSSTLRDATNQTRPMEGVQSNNQASNNEANNEPNRNSKDQSNGVKPNQVNEPPPVIPLPPPPVQSRSPTNGCDNPGQTFKQQNETCEVGGQQNQVIDQAEIKKPRKEAGSGDIIESTRQEVNDLLKEIATCNEVSQESKEYRRLDELLTRCVLRLDNIDCSETPELRPQRKAIIAMVDKCTDILKRRVSLNYDIQQMTAKMS